MRADDFAAKHEEAGVYHAIDHGRTEPDTWGVSLCGKPLKEFTDAYVRSIPEFMRCRHRACAAAFAELDAVIAFADRERVAA